MNTQDAIRYTLELSETVMRGYLEDLSDEDILIQPVEGMNTIAWQLGHLIASENMILDSVREGASPTLPDGFADLHSQDQAQKVPTEKYLTKGEYLDLFQKQRKATVEALETLTEEELKKPAPESLQSIAKTGAECMMLIGGHYYMHLGQFVAVRRKLEKPIAM